jgi:hypothetical protein
MRVNKIVVAKRSTNQQIDGHFALQYTDQPINAVLAWSGGAIQIRAGTYELQGGFFSRGAGCGCIRAHPRGQLVDTIAIPSQVDGGKASGVPATVNETGFDRPATSDHPEGGADSLALGDSSASDPMAPRSGGESGDNAPDAMGSLAAPESSTLTRLLIIFSDLRARILGGP